VMEGNRASTATLGSRLISIRDEVAKEIVEEGGIGDYQQWESQRLPQSKDRDLKGGESMGIKKKRKKR